MRVTERDEDGGLLGRVGVDSVAEPRGRGGRCCHKDAALLYVSGIPYPDILVRVRG
jgi:hypothetical protein